MVKDLAFFSAFFTKLRFFGRAWNLNSSIISQYNFNTYLASNVGCIKDTIFYIYLSQGCCGISKVLSDSSCCDVPSIICHFRWYQRQACLISNSFNHAHHFIIFLPHLGFYEQELAEFYFLFHSTIVV